VKAGDSMVLIASVTGNDNVEDFNMANGSTLKIIMYVATSLISIRDRFFHTKRDYRV
jgi:hypothetical protein